MLLYLFLDVLILMLLISLWMMSEREECCVGIKEKCPQKKRGRLAGSCSGGWHDKEAVIMWCVGGELTNTLSPIRTGVVR